LSVYIIAFEQINIPDIINIIGEFFNHIATASAVLFIFETILLFSINLASGVLIIYASIAIGHLFNRHRIISSFGAFIGLSTLSQIYLTVVTLIFNDIYTFPVMHDYSSIDMIIPGIHTVIWYMILITGLISAVYFIITNYILSRRLNLE
jgi:hypothetical protein